MSAPGKFFCSTIGRKQLVGATGLGLSLFVLTHMLGNLLVFVGPEAYNMYSHKLVTNPLIYVAEAGLVIMFIIHLGFALKLSLANKLARPENYAVSASGDKGTHWVQKTMWHQGVIILVFVVLHLITFKFGSYYETTIDGQRVRDLFRLMEEVFMQPLYVCGYIFALFVLGFHLSHGVSSAIRTLGFNHPSYDSGIRKIGFLYAVLVAGGFISQPLYIYFLN